MDDTLFFKVFLFFFLFIFIQTTFAKKILKTKIKIKLISKPDKKLKKTVY